MKKINKKLAAACILSVLCAGYSTIGFAAEEKEEKAELQSFALDEYVVTANRTEQTIFNANANISVVTKADIERMHYDSLDKALTSVPGVQFQNYSGGMLNANVSTPVRINGSKNVLILVDGVRLTPLGGGAGSVNPNFLNNMDNVERIEVLKGAAGVLYGSDAAGGVINIITKKDGESKTTLKATTGSFGKDAYHFSNKGTEGVVSWNVYYDKDQKGNFEDGNGTEIENKWNSHAAGFDMSAQINDKQSLTLKYDESSADFSAINLKFYQGKPQRGEVYMQDLVMSHKWNFDDNTTNVLTYKSGRSLTSWQTTDWKNNWSTVQGPAYKTRTVTDQFTKVFDDKHTVIVGADFDKTIFGKWNKSTDINDANVTWGDFLKNQSYYIQEKWTFDDKWNSTIGLRYDIAEANKDGKSKDMDKNLSKSLNIAHKFDDRNNIYVSYDEYFIIPTADQLFSPEYGDENLEPAKGKNYSIGYNYIIDDNNNLSVHAFRRKADVTIGLTGDATASQYSNYKNSKDVGFDIQYNKRFDSRWDAYVGYSFLKHESDANYWVDTLKLGYLPRHSVTMGVNYSYDKWDIGLTGRGFLSRDDAQAAGSENDSMYKMNWPNNHYWIFNIAANYQATKNVKVFAAVNNIFDTLYAESMVQGAYAQPGDYYSMPGRSFVAGVEVSF